MRKLDDCPSCSGFLPPGATACALCGAKIAKGRDLPKRGLAGAIASGLFSVLLMACYGQPPDPPCPDGPDADGDGFPSADTSTTCEIRSDHHDCNDGDPATHPGANDPFGDNVDQNCDGHDGFECPSIDQDEDGSRVWQEGPDCWVPDEYTAPDHQDCDDQDPEVHPYAADPSKDCLLIDQ
jgi:hypothetical protein